MLHELDPVGGEDDNTTGFFNLNSGAMQTSHGNNDRASSFQVTLSNTTQNDKKPEKIFFTVLDVTDGRRYKVFLRPNDISRLKISKVRKTLSSASGKPPFSFDLLLGDELLLGMEDVNCATLGITSQTVLLMRPTSKSKEEALQSSMEAVNNESRDLGGLTNVGTSTLRVDSVLREFSDTTAGMPFVVNLNERQRALQAQLFEEAKRSHIFLADGSGDGGDKSNTSNSAYPSNCPNTEKLPHFRLSVDQVAEEQACCADSFTEFFEEIVNTRPTTQQGSSSLPTLSTEQCIEVNTKGQSRTVAAETPVSSDKKSSHLESLLQGECYYDMYYHEDDERAVLSSNLLHTDTQSEKGRDSSNGRENKAALEENSQTAADKTMMACNAEADLMQLVENLRDDVSNLLALQVRNETIKQILQRDLSVSQRRVRQLEKKNEEERQQLDVLLSHIRRSHHVNGTPVFSENELRVALRNMAAVHHNELLVRENAALEQRLAQEVRKRREMVFTLEDMKGHIRVLVRVRPPFRLLHEPHTVGKGVKVTSTHIVKDEAFMTADEQRNSITITDPHTGTRQYNFYRVFSKNSTQAEVFSEVAPLVQLACDGVNVSVVAYGQTGSGKTYTILGRERPRSNITSEEGNNDGDKEREEDDGTEEEEDDGILPRTIRMLFQHLHAEAVTEAVVMPHVDNNNEANEEQLSSMYEVSCSLVELYNDKVQDLLASPQVVTPAFHVCSTNSAEQRGPMQVAPQRSSKIGPDGLMYVVGLTQHVVRDARDALKVLSDGASRRQVHATQQNFFSSRSHLIFTVHLAQKRRVPLQNTTGRTSPSSLAFKRLESKLVFVDLAGSERVAKSQSVGERLLEARYINKSLSALGDVVASLSSVAPSAAGSVHIPYRNSTLTALLQDVIGSRSKTVLVACVSPSDPPYETHTAETTSTLQFASRVRCVRNFAPPFPSVGCNTPIKKSNALGVEGNIDQSTTLCTAERGGAKLWMRPTKSSRRRASAMGRQNAALVNEAEGTEERGRMQTSAPFYTKRESDPNVDYSLKLRF